MRIAAGMQRMAPLGEAVILPLKMAPLALMGCPSVHAVRLEPCALAPIRMGKRHGRNVSASNTPRHLFSPLPPSCICVTSVEPRVFLLLSGLNRPALPNSTTMKWTMLIALLLAQGHVVLGLKSAPKGFLGKALDCVTQKNSLDCDLLDQCNWCVSSKLGAACYPGTAARLLPTSECVE